MGCKTLYKENYIKKVYDYIESCVDKPYQQIVSDGVKGTSWQHKVKVNIPTIENLAKVLKVCRFSIYNWEKEHPDFAEALEALRAEQCNKLIQNGLSGDYNPLITRLILSTNHGMKERSDVTTNDDPINTFTDSQAERIAERVLARKGATSDKLSEK